MTTRDRLMLIGVVALAVLGAAWFTMVAPERERASKVTAEVQAAHQRLSTAEAAASTAAGARARYSTAYASLVSLGQAVPATTETPALIYMLDSATHSRNVQFSSITNGSAGASSASASATPVAQSAGFSQQPFTFVFNGSFVDLYKLFNQLEGFTVQTPSGTVHVNGRLLTIDSVSLAPGTTGTTGSSAASKSTSPQLTGTVTATAYVLPAGQSPLAGATASGPGGADHERVERDSSGSDERRHSGRCKGDPMTEFLQSLKSDLLSRRLLPLVALLGVALLAAVAYAVTGGSSPSSGRARAAKRRSGERSRGIAGRGRAGQPQPGGLRDAGRIALSEPRSNARPVHSAARTTEGSERERRYVLEFLEQVDGL